MKEKTRQIVNLWNPDRKENNKKHETADILKKYSEEIKEILEKNNLEKAFNAFLQFIYRFEKEKWIRLGEHIKSMFVLWWEKKLIKHFEKELKNLGINPSIINFYPEVFSKKIVVNMFLPESYLEKHLEKEKEKMVKLEGKDIGIGTVFKKIFDSLIITSILDIPYYYTCFYADSDWFECSLAKNLMYNLKKIWITPVDTYKTQVFGVDIYVSWEILYNDIIDLIKDIYGSIDKEEKDLQKALTEYFESLDYAFSFLKAILLERKDLDITEDWINKLLFSVEYLFNLYKIILQSRVSLHKFWWDGRYILFNCSWYDISFSPKSSKEELESVKEEIKKNSKKISWFEIKLPRIHGLGEIEFFESEMNKLAVWLKKFWIKLSGGKFETRHGDWEDYIVSFSFYRE